MIGSTTVSELAESAIPVHTIRTIYVNHVFPAHLSGNKGSAVPIRRECTVERTRATSTRIEEVNLCRGLLLHTMHVSGSRVFALVFTTNRMTNITCRSRQTPIGCQLLIIRKEVVGIEFLCLFPTQRIDTKGIYALRSKVGGVAFTFAVKVGKYVVETCLEVQALYYFILGGHHSRESIFTLHARVHVDKPIGVVLAVLHVSPTLHRTFEAHIVRFAFVHATRVLICLVISLLRNPATTFVHIIVTIPVHINVAGGNVSVVNGIKHRSTTRSVGGLGANEVGRNLHV